jgi:2-octaprenyl-6-methoxyphenol hydroxylase
MEKGVTTSIDVDVLIVGGGLVGATLAKALSTLNLQVTLVEKQFLAGLPDTKPVLDQRALALNYGTLSIFKNLLGLDLSALGAQVQNIYVSDQHGFGRIALNAADEVLPYFGCVIPILVLTKVLQAAVLHDPKITCITGVCKQLQQDEHGVECEVDGKHLRAKILIGADGATSQVREFLNISTRIHDYEQTALIGNVKVQALEAHTAYERFTHEGPLALLPFDQDHMTLVWVMPTALAEMRQKLPAMLLLQDLQKIMGYRVGRFLALGHLQAYSLQQVVAEQTYDKRIGLLGNAAHSLHPVAGQGFNLSMRDIFGFYQTLKRYQDLLDQPDIIWEEYLRVRHHDQVRTIAITDALIKMFTQKNPLVQGVRNSLMLNLELCPYAKTALNEVMVGLT